MMYNSNKLDSCTYKYNNTHKHIGFVNKMRPKRKVKSTKLPRTNAFARDPWYKPRNGASHRQALTKATKFASTLM